VAVLPFASIMAAITYNSHTNSAIQLSDGTVVQMPITTSDVALQTKIQTSPDYGGDIFIPSSFTRSWNDVKVASVQDQPLTS